MKNIRFNKIIATVLVLILLISTCFVAQIPALADDSIDYSFDAESGTLRIYGSGAMADYDQEDLTSRPWQSFVSSISTVVIDQGITHVGAYAFSRANALSSVSLSSTVTSIGECAFSGCDNLKSIVVPDSVTDFGDYAFGYDFDMEVTDGFVAYCGFNSAAQRYCLRSYVPFDTQLDSNGNGTAVALGSNWQSMWSFVPVLDGTVTFYSTGGFDTYGLIYDSNDYMYSDQYFNMQNSALATSDDQGDNVNFCLTYNVTAGTRYYLAAKFSTPTKKSGSFAVHATFQCADHQYELISSTATCTHGGDEYYRCIGCGDSYMESVGPSPHDYRAVAFDSGVVTVACQDCGTSYQCDFIDYLNGTNAPLDIVADGIINAKDYAKFVREY